MDWARLEARRVSLRVRGIQRPGRVVHAMCSYWSCCARDGCRATVPSGARTCSRCGSESLSWAFKIDLAAPGSPRKQTQRSGFATKAAAVETLNRLQAGVVDGTHVERSRRTLSAYLVAWLAGKTNLRANTRRDYSTGIVNHINPRLGDVPLQAIDRLQVRAMYPGARHERTLREDDP